jgi:hypothetical protein
MFAKHAGTKQFPETMLLTYSAKRRAEVAPGVGEDTDMVAVFGTGGLSHISEDQLAELERCYTGVRQRTERAIARGDEQVKSYFQGLLDAAAAAAATKTAEQAAPTAKPSTSEKEGAASPPTAAGPEQEDRKSGDN